MSKVPGFCSDFIFSPWQYLLSLSVCVSLRWWAGQERETKCLWLLEGGGKEGTGQSNCFQKKYTFSFSPSCRSSRQLNLAEKKPNPSVPKIIPEQFWALSVLEARSMKYFGRVNAVSLAYIFVKTMVIVLMASPGAFRRELSYWVIFANDNMNVVNTHCFPRYTYWCVIWISSVCSIKLIYQVYKKPFLSLLRS